MNIIKLLTLINWNQTINPIHNMNKRYQLLSISFLIAMCLFASCSKKKDDIKPAPTLTIDSVSGTSDITMGYFTVGYPIKINYTVSSDNNLDRISISESAVQSIASTQKPSVQTTPDRTTGFDTPTSYKGTYNTTFPIGASSFTITIKATDLKGQITSKTFTAKTAIAYTSGLGAQSNTTYGPYIASLTSTVAFKTEADFTANKNNIDVTFGQFGNPISAMLISSDQRNIDGITTGVGGLKTYFKSSSLNFNTVQPKDIANITQSSSQKITIAQDSTYEFVSPSIGSKGLIHIKTYNNGGNNPTGGYIIFDLLVVNTKQ
jgi:hypothetical protein